MAEHARRSFGRETLAEQSPRSRTTRTTCAPETSARVNGHVRACVDAAALLGVPAAGRVRGGSADRVKQGLRIARRTLAPLLAD
jgi:hypothetical protein